MFRSPLAPPDEWSLWLVVVYVLRTIEGTYTTPYPVLRLLYCRSILLLLPWPFGCSPVDARIGAACPAPHDPGRYTHPKYMLDRTYMQTQACIPDSILRAKNTYICVVQRRLLANLGPTRQTKVPRCALLQHHPPSQLGFVCPSRASSVAVIFFSACPLSPSLCIL